MIRLLVSLALWLACPAFARQVSVQWEPIKGASKYEIEINGDRVSVKETLPSTAREWKGELPAGQYAYRIRAIDSNSKAGTWTSFQSFTIRGNDYHIAGGIDAGTNYFFPGLHLQRVITPRIAIGFHPTFSGSFQNFAQIYSFGFFATGTYFLTESAYNGFSVQAALGGYWIHEPFYSQTALPLAFSMAVRWRHELKYGFDVALGAGGQYISDASKDKKNWVVDFKGFLPYFTVDIGFSF